MKRLFVGHLMCGFAGMAVAAAIMAAPLTAAAGETASIMRGGQIYDKWYKVVGSKAPKKSHPLYPAGKKYAKKPKTNWRCKECHGWDYRGKDGAYGKGKHATGIKGVAGVAGGDPAKVVALLKGDHGYGDKLNDTDLQDVALFLTKGQVDMTKYIDGKKAKGDASKGESYYATICANCHGADGLKPKSMPPLGKLASKNPWEVLHKILYGQPGEKMPALSSLDRQVPVDILAYLATLPKK